MKESSFGPCLAESVTYTDLETEQVLDLGSDMHKYEVVETIENVFEKLDYTAVLSRPRCSLCHFFILQRLEADSLNCCQGRVEPFHFHEAPFHLHT